nr:hypothetical protein [Tanacetum cinerariifolium]
MVMVMEVEANLMAKVVAEESCTLLEDYCFIGYPFDYHVTLGFRSIAGGLDHVNHVIRLPIESGISRRTLLALAGPNLESMHKDLIVTVYPKVYKNLEHIIEENVFLENPPSSSGTLLSMKNLDDAFTFSDQFIHDKSPKDEVGKAIMDTEVKSMVTVLIHQASSSAPPLSTLIISLTLPKLVSPPA